MNIFTFRLRTFFLLLLLLAISLLSACAKEEGAKRATVLDIFGITEKNPDKNTKEIVFADDDLAWERNNEEIDDAENKTVGSDGSEITTLKDAFGNVTYQRIFRNDPRLKRVVIVSSPDGEQIIYLYGQDSGKVVRITDETAGNFLEMSADNIADLAGLQQPIKGSSFDEPQISSSLPVKNASVPNQNQPEYSEDYKTDFPRINENDSQMPAQTKTGNSENKQINPPQTKENN
jgi:hypothetical protein